MNAKKFLSVALAVVLLIEVLMGLSAHAAASTTPTKVIFVGSSLNTAYEAAHQANVFAMKLDAAAPGKYTVENVYNPYCGPKDDGFVTCALEIFLGKTSEELYKNIFLELTNSNLTAEQKKNSAKTVVGFVDYSMPGGNSVEGKLSPRFMDKKRDVIYELAKLIESGDSVVVTYGDGALIANLAYAVLYQKYGDCVNKMMQVVTVGNASDISVHRFNLTQKNDGVLFSNTIPSYAVSIETLPSFGNGWNRTTPECYNSNCNFKVAAPTFAGVPADNGNLRGHGFLEVYLSDQLTHPLDLGNVDGTLGINTFARHLINMIQAASSKL